MSISDELYPIAIIEDRYNGVYSKGKWVAIASSRFQMVAFVENCTNFEYLDNYGFGDDCEADKFWDTHKDELWIAVGDTPDEALKNLVEKQLPKDHKDCDEPEGLPDSKTAVYENDET